MYERKCYDVLTMQKRLTRTGNSHALVLDKGILEATGIDSDTMLEVSTDGDVILISPVRDEDRVAKLQRGLDRMHERYAGAFRRLAQ